MFAAKLSKGNIYFNIDWGKEEWILKFVCLDAHFDIEEGEGEDSNCPNNFVQGCRKKNWRRKDNSLFF